MSEPLIFGAFTPQGWKGELARVGDAAAQWAKTVEIAVLAEELGYDSVWVYDHFHNVPEPAGQSVFECWTTVAVLSQRTSRIRLGQMVGCAAYRNPALLAKITANVDVMSGGRLDWGIGAGWYEGEFDGYGYEFRRAADRIRFLRETVEVVTRLWAEPEVSYEGRFTTLQAAQCDPKPLQRPRPPVWIGGSGEQLTLRVVARHADRSNWGGAPEVWSAKRDVLRRHCDEVGRDEGEIVKTWSPEVLVRETEAEVRAAAAALVGDADVESWRRSHLVGTPDQVAEKVQAYVDLGCGGFVPWCRDYPDDTTLRLFAERVVPGFR